jgi:hypothetical protein
VLAGGSSESLRIMVRETLDTAIFRCVLEAPSTAHMTILTASGIMTPFASLTIQRRALAGARYSSGYGRQAAFATLKRHGFTGQTPVEWSARCGVDCPARPRLMSDTSEWLLCLWQGSGYNFVETLQAHNNLLWKLQDTCGNKHCDSYGK